MKELKIKIEDLFKYISYKNNEQIKYDIPILFNKNIFIQNKEGEWKKILSFCKKTDILYKIQFTHFNMIAGSKHLICLDVQSERCVFVKDLKKGSQLNYIREKVVGKTEMGNGDVFDIQIDDESHLYRTTNGVVNHNSELVKIINAVKKNVITMSTTGITALNLSVDGIVAQTPYSFLGISPVEIIPISDIRRVSKNLSLLLSKCNLIIIDEVSMMSNQLFDFIIKKIKFIRKTVPRMILFGDPMQLPPVVNMNNSLVKDYYDNNYGGKIMFFNSDSFLNMNFETLSLSRSFRQKDPLFEKNLTKIGYGDYTEETLDYFNSRVMTQKQFEIDHPKYIQLCPTNSMVNRKNVDYINNLYGEEIVYESKVRGIFDKNKAHNDEKVKIKVGAQIICVKNNYNIEAGTNYRNGTIGTVIEVNPSWVRIQKEDGSTTKVVQSITPNNQLYIDSLGNINYQEIGTFQQIDAKIAKAISIHKSQGNSLDNAYISFNNFSPEALIYVALSRLRSLEGLGLSKKITPEMIKYNRESFDYFCG